jgi:hypothetical protein
MPGRRFAFPNQRRLVRGGRAEMPVQTIVTDIQFAADNHFAYGQFPLQDFFPRLEPDQFRLWPGAPRIFPADVDGFAVKLAVLRHANPHGRARKKLLRRRKDSFLMQHGSDICAGQGRCFGHRFCAFVRGRIVSVRHTTSTPEKVALLRSANQVLTMQPARRAVRGRLGETTSLPKSDWRRGGSARI